MSSSLPDIVAAGYDAVYAALPKSPTLVRLWREHALGSDYPEGFEPISFVSFSELQRIRAELQLAPGQTLVDLGCGLAGPGLWIARETGARLIGVDLSSIACAAAAERAANLGLAAQARFTVGSFASTGLDGESADACLSLDALQYAPDKAAALAEAARILRPGGRLVFQAFELDRERSGGLPVVGADPVDDYRPYLAAAGFAVAVYEETPGWAERLTSAYRAISDAGTSLVEEMGEAAWLALSSEVSLTLERRPYCGHVLAVAAKA